MIMYALVLTRLGTLLFLHD